MLHVDAEEFLILERLSASLRASAVLALAMMRFSSFAQEGFGF